MKTTVTLLLFFLSVALHSQISDQFTDGNFTTNPHWAGDSIWFEVNSARQLHLAATGSDTAVLATSMDYSAETEWRFWLKVSFNPSANNFVRIYLISGNQSLKGPVNGYFLQAGGINDSVSIFRQDGLANVRLFTCPGFSVNHSLNVLRLRITRDHGGAWEVYADSTGGEDWISEGAFTDDEYPSQGWLGVFCRFTSSNSSKFYFDDCYCGPVQTDTLAPKVSELLPGSGNSLKIIFSETVNRLTAEDPGNYLEIGTGFHPVTAVRDPDNPKCILLGFADTFPSEGCDSLLVTGISDPGGNTMSDSVIVFCFHTVKAFDVVIDEIMADPDPAAGLPASEYIELYNRCAFPVSLDRWTLGYGYSSKMFPDLLLPSNGYFLVSSDTAMGNFGAMAQLFTSAAALSNEEMRLSLRNADGAVIHSVQYSREWFNGTFKEDGGWSLEMIDPANPCACSENWVASNDLSGGTPGRINSVNGINPDTIPPVLWRGMILSPGKLEAKFSEPMDSVALENPETWILTGTGDKPDSVHPGGPDHSSAFLYFQPEFEGGKEYAISCEPWLTDCAGNRMAEPGHLTLAIPEEPVPGDIVINEILPEPGPGGSRFVELYNRGEKPLELSDLSMSCSKDTSVTDPLIPEPVSADHFLFMPGAYVALCGDVKQVITRYGTSHPEVFVQIESFPVFGPELGQVVLLRKNDGAELDRVVFDHSMHHPLLSNTTGVSLERVSPGRPSADGSNWHSAASSFGYGTPGEKNSQWFEPAPEDATVSLQPRIFSPDNDGKDDQLGIVFHFDGPGYTVNAKVFDKRGVFVKSIENSVLSAPEGVITWDGLNERHERVDTGIYIILVEIFQPDGKVRTFKKTAIVASRF